MSCDDSFNQIMIGMDKLVLVDRCDYGLWTQHSEGVGNGNKGHLYYAVLRKAHVQLDGVMCEVTTRGNTHYIFSQSKDVFLPE